MRMIVLMLATAIAAAGARSDEVAPEDFELQTTRELYEICTTPEDHEFIKYAVGTCLGYVLGAAHYHIAASGPDYPPLTCPPDDLSLVDLARTFAEWAHRHRQDEILMHELPVQGVMRASAAQWPCRNDPA